MSIRGRWVSGGTCLAQGCLILLLLGLAPAACRTAAPPLETSTECRRRLPASLLAVFPARAPGFQIVEGYERRAYDVVVHEATCHTVVSGDFDGDLRPDFAFVAQSPEGDAILFAARQVREGAWALDRLFNAGPLSQGTLVLGLIGGTAPGSAGPLSIVVEFTFSKCYVFSHPGDAWVRGESETDQCFTLS